MVSLNEAWVHNYHRHVACFPCDCRRNLPCDDRHHETARPAPESNQQELHNKSLSTTSTTSSRINTVIRKQITIDPCWMRKFCMIDSTFPYLLAPAQWAWEHSLVVLEHALVVRPETGPDWVVAAETAGEQGCECGQVRDLQVRESQMHGWLGL